jgi:hypothetical protein
LVPFKDGSFVAAVMFMACASFLETQCSWGDVYKQIVDGLAEIAPKALLNGPSPEAKRHLVDLPIDYYSGTRINGGGGQAFVEHFRVEADGKVKETQYQLVSREEPHPLGQAEPEAEQDGWRDRGWDNRGPAAEQGWGAWDWGRRDAQPASEQRWGAWGWERRNAEPYAEQRWGTWDRGRRDGQSYYPPQSRQSLQPAASQSRDRRSPVPARSNTDDRRTRAPQTPNRLQNGGLN